MADIPTTGLPITDLPITKNRDVVSSGGGRFETRGAPSNGRGHTSGTLRGQARRSFALPPLR
jgi:hypothetical protein